MARRTLRLAPIAAVTLAAALAPVTALAQTYPPGREVMGHVTRDHRSRDERAEVEVAIEEGGGTVRRRTAVFLTRAGEGSNDHLRIRFEAPPDIRGTALLTLERDDGEDQWVFLPSLHRTRRIAASGRSQRFAGTDFTYEDLRSEQVARHAYRVLREETLDGAACWVLEATPTAEEAASSAYGRRVLWVRRDHHLLVRIEYFDRDDRPVKVRSNVDWRQESGLWRFHGTEMRDLVRGTRTLMRFRRRELNPGLPESLFTPEALERE